MRQAIFNFDPLDRVKQLGRGTSEDRDLGSLQPDGPITGSPLVLANGMLVATESGTVFAYDATGSKLWDAIIGGKIYTTPVAAGDRIAVAPTGTDFLLAMLDQNGKLLWKFTGK